MAHRMLAGIVLCFCAALQQGLTARGQQPEHSAPINLSHSLPIVKVLVDGQGPFSFVIDTGTSDEAIISPSLARRLNLAPTGKKKLTDLAQSGERMVDTVKLDVLSVAGADFHDAQALISQFPGADHDYDGILGFLLFRDKQLTLDYPHKKVLFSDEPIPSADVAQFTPFQIRQGIPIVTIRVNGQEADAVVDSGGFGIDLPENISGKLGFSGNIAILAKGQTAVSSFLVRGGTMIGEIGLDGYRFGSPFVEMSSIFPMASLGSTALRDFTITFDQRSKLLRLSAAKKDHRVGVPEKDALHLPVTGDVVSQAIMSHGQL